MTNPELAQIRGKLRKQLCFVARRALPLLTLWLECHPWKTLKEKKKKREEMRLFRSAANGVRSRAFRMRECRAGNRIEWEQQKQQQKNKNKRNDEKGSRNGKMNR